MPRKKSPVVNGNTKNRILDTATRLFALRGFKSVTLRDICKEVRVKIPTVYYHYKDKDTLIAGVLARFEEVYDEHRKWLADRNENAESVEDVINNLFNREFLEKLNPVSRLGMSMILKEQHNYENAQEVAVKHIYENSIRNIQTGFDRLIEKKVIPPSDTKTLATIFMFCVTAGNEVLMYDLIDRDMPIDFTNIYNGLKKIMMSALTQGTLKADG